MDPQEVQIAEPVASPIPGVLALRFRVPKSKLRQAIMPTPLETTYLECQLPGRIRLDEFGSYVFSSDQDGSAGYHEFLFVPERSAAEIATPVPSLSHPDTQPFPWKPCLIQLGALEDDTQPLTFEAGPGTSVQVPRLFGRMHLLPGGMYASEIETEVFVAHRPFTREEMGVLETQVTTRLQWQGRNLDVDLDCLHGLVEFPETQTSGRAVSGLGTVNNPLVLTGKTVFPPTPMPKWKRHLFDQRHEPVGGMWRLTNQWVNPPRGARRILGAAV